MSSQPAKRRLSRRSAGDSGPQSPDYKKVKAEPTSDSEVLGSQDVVNLEDSELDEVYIPDPDGVASEGSSTGELDDDGDSDAVGAIASRAKHAADHAQSGGPTKWDADAKRARYQERYGDKDPEEALGQFALRPLFFWAASNKVPPSQARQRVAVGRL